MVRGYLHNVGMIGKYWSSTPRDESTAYGFAVVIGGTSSDVMGSSDRDNGYLIRPVVG